MAVSTLTILEFGETREVEIDLATRTKAYGGILILEDIQRPQANPGGTEVESFPINDMMAEVKADHVRFSRLDGIDKTGPLKGPIFLIANKKETKIRVIIR